MAIQSTEIELGSHIVPSNSARTLPGLFQQRCERSLNKPAFRQYEADNWRSYSWRDITLLAGRWQKGLKRENLKPGDRVAVSLSNSVEWVCFDQASLAQGLVVVPLYTADNPDNMIHILADSGARLLLLDSDARWLPLAAQRHALQDLSRVLCLKHETTPQDDIVRYVTDWLPEGPCALEMTEGEPDDLATLVYTSGTTGRPKGVMLSHRNILCDAEAVLRRIPAFPSDVFLSFLPLAHSFERTVGYYLPMMAGCEVCYARSIELLREDLQIVRPTVLLSVPRIYDKIYLAIQSKLAQRKLARWLLNTTVAIGWRMFEAAQGGARRPGLASRLVWPLLRRLVAAPILEKLGGRLRVAVSGGAPLSASIARFFIGLGVPLTEGYGLTEAAPVVSGIAPGDYVPGSVGQALPGIELQVASNGELLARGPVVMRGYWNQPEATRSTIDNDGWLHSGDLAEIRDGTVYIRGRIKEVLVTSTGEKVPPADMEMALTLDPLFDQALIIGEGRPFLGALLVLSPEAWDTFARGLGLDPDDPAALSAEEARRAVLSKVQVCLQTFPGYARVRAVHLSIEPWTIDNGLITPTLKVKRGALETQFADAIDSLYSG